MSVRKKIQEQEGLDKGRIYWQDLSALEKEVPDTDEFAGVEKEEVSRRDFLKWMGFSVAAVSLAACETPVRKAIPYLNKPEDIDPGTANYYASAYIGQSQFAPLVVKTREGRPIKVTPNQATELGHLFSPQTEASVLDLYDKNRLPGPTKNGNPIDWGTLDKEVMAALKKIQEDKKELTVLSHSLPSPTLEAVLNEVKTRCGNVKHVSYDAISYSAALDVNERYFGLRAFPTYRFDRAKTIVSFGADFLGTWLAPGLFSKQFSETRKLNNRKRDMSRLHVIESLMSLTGANADHRTVIQPTDMHTQLSLLYSLLARAEGLMSLRSTPIRNTTSYLKDIAQELLAQKGHSVVVCGHNDPACQSITLAINQLLGNYGKTLLWSQPYRVKQGSDLAFAEWIQRMQKGKVGGVIFLNCNPMYDRAAERNTLRQALSKLTLSVSTASAVDETAAETQYVTPDHHYLESWQDIQPVQDGDIYLSQPTISPVFNTRQAAQSLLRWTGKNISYRSYLKERWWKALPADEDKHYAWNKALAMGYSWHAVKDLNEIAPKENIFQNISSLLKETTTDNPNPSSFQLLLYESIAIGSGTQANNPWLQELPDPLTKVCWENYATLAPKDAQHLGIKIKDVRTKRVLLNIGTESIELPVVIQPGQAEKTVCVALGYGRKKVGKVGRGRGKNVYDLQTTTYKHASVGEVNISKTGKAHTLARMQTQSTHMGRQTILQEATLSEYQKDPAAGRFHPKIATSKGKLKPEEVSLWKEHNYPKHHWGMVIDLNSCTGCQACVVACQSENNLPVVGKEEVSKRRDMHWLRIDRYYASHSQNAEQAAQNPEVTFQPMMCQHCNHAPCETVCPVAATTHSSEGLNQMAYNRCVGTRYCANNCPYKVRRFNWFKYHDNQQFPENSAMNNALGKMVLNPDVTVRARGVMEKCTFCVQRIQHAKLQAKQRGDQHVREEEVRTACSAACVTGAISFGDLKDPNSSVAQTLKLNPDTGQVQEKRAYHVLEELNVSPNVWYLTKIRNKRPNISREG